MQQNYYYFFFWEGKKEEERNREVGAFSSADTTKPQRQDAAHVHVLTKIK